MISDRDAILTCVLAGWYGLYNGPARVMLALYRAHGPVPRITLARRANIKLSALKVQVSYARAAMSTNRQEAIVYADRTAPEYEMTPFGKAQILKTFHMAIGMMEEQTSLKLVSDERAAH